MNIDFINNKLTFKNKTLQYKMYCKNDCYANLLANKEMIDIK
jgi:hypothetical protein